MSLASAGSFDMQRKEQVSCLVGRGSRGVHNQRMGTRLASAQRALPRPQLAGNVKNRHDCDGMATTATGTVTTRMGTGTAVRGWPLPRQPQPQKGRPRPRSGRHHCNGHDRPRGAQPQLALASPRGRQPRRNGYGYHKNNRGRDWDAIIYN